MSVRLLVTGFSPFGTHAGNPSERLVRLLADDAPPGVVLSTRVLPVLYDLSFAMIQDVLETERLHGALLLGLGAGREDIQFERFAVNWRGSPTFDNGGRQIDGEPIDPAGPAAYFSTVPLEQMVSACSIRGVPASISSHAGTFLCNEVLFRALRLCDVASLRCRVGFAHLPFLTGQAGIGDDPHLPESVQLAGVRAALECLAGMPPADDFEAWSEE